MTSLDQFKSIFNELFDQFIDVRADAGTFKQEQKKIFEWVKGRSSRR